MRNVSKARRLMLLGYAAALGAALSYGGGTLVGRKVVTEYTEPMVATAFSMLVGTLFVAAISYRDVPSDLASRPPRRAWILVALAGFAAAFAVSCFFLALSKGPVVLVAPLAGVNPLIAIILAHTFLQRLERVTLQTVAGGTFVVAGVALIAVGSG